MAANTLVITKAYRDGIAFTEAIVDGIRSDLQSWGQDAVDNLNQMRLDVFGSSYAYDNDGLANNTNPMNVAQTITPAATTAALTLAGTALTTANGITGITFDGLTTGSAFNFTSNSSDASTRTLGIMINDNTAATSTTILECRQDANARGIFINKDGTGAGVGLEIDNEGTGNAITVNHATDSLAVGIISEHATLSSSMILCQATRTANSAYSFYVGASNAGGDNEIRLRGDGEVSGDAAAYVTPAADYAEMFECVEKAGIEPGYFVTLDKKEPDKIRKATSKDTYILGIISGKPAIVADTDWNRWAKKYLYDEFNRYLLDEKGNRILNPKYNPKFTHLTRAERPEWVAVGMLGKLNVRYTDPGMDDCIGFVEVDGGGCAVDVGSKSGYKVLSNVMKYNKEKGYGVIKIIFRGKE